MQREREVTSLREQLEAAWRGQQEFANNRARELDRLNPGQRDFVRATAGGLRDSAADGLDQRERQQIEQLLRLAPSFRQEVQYAETIAAGGTPVSRPDRVAELEGRLATVLEKLDAAISNEAGLRTVDAALDSRAAQTAEEIVRAFEGASERIRQLDTELNSLKSQLIESSR